MLSLLAPAACVLAMVLAVAGVLATAGGARAALQKPTYTEGDQWVYILQSSLNGFPGLNESQGNVSLGLSGLVEVDVQGPARATVGGIEVPGVRAETHASGFLNGTFVIRLNGTSGLPGNGTVHASGTFASDSSEIWEGTDYLPTVTNSSSSYTISATVGLTISMTAGVSVNASTEWTGLPTFNLTAGESASAAFVTNASVTTTFSFLMISNRTQNRTSASGLWDRHVLDLENVTVEAGTFPAYRMNQSLGLFPGLGFALPSGSAYETAWFSNTIGSYAMREAYVNGTKVAEMHLKSYTYPAAPRGLSLADLTLLAAVPLAAIAIAAFVVLRRRRRKPQQHVTTGTAGPVGDLPPKPPEGRP